MARRNAWSGGPAISASVAGASTSQKMRIASAREAAMTPSSSSSSNTPTPLALTTTSAAAACAATARIASGVAGYTTTSRPVRRLDIAVLLPVEGVGFVEGDAVAAPGEVAQQAAIVGGGAVPVGGQQARSVEGDLHAVISAGSGRRSRRHDRQQLLGAMGGRCGARAIARARCATSAAAAPDRRASASRCRSIAAPSCATR